MSHYTANDSKPHCFVSLRNRSPNLPPPLHGQLEQHVIRALRFFTSRLWLRGADATMTGLRTMLPWSRSRDSPWETVKKPGRMHIIFYAHWPYCMTLLYSPYCTSSSCSSLPHLSLLTHPIVTLILLYSPYCNPHPSIFTHLAVCTHSAILTLLYSLIMLHSLTLLSILFLLFSLTLLYALIMLYSLTLLYSLILLY